MPAKKQSEQPSSLDDAMASLNKQFGAGSVFQFGSMPRQAVEVIPTGSISLDAALGIGGVPRGRVVEIFGPEASGKTTIALHLIANAQKQGLIAGMVDAEHALDPDYAKNLGVNMDAVVFNQPGSGEEGLAVVDRLLVTNELAIIVIDSVAALVPQAEIDGEMGDTHIGLQARLMSQALRKITAHAAEAKTTVVFINQLRQKVGLVFGNPETTTGGKALPFYASVRLDARGLETLKDGTDAIGRRTKIKVVKNKLAAPFRTAVVDIMFGQGINREGELLDLGLACGVLRKTGSHHYFGEQALGNGRESARNTLRAEPELAGQVEAAIRKIGLANLSAPQEQERPPLPDKASRKLADPFDGPAPVS